LSADSNPEGFPESRIKITEIFLSIQGEAQFSGWPTIFIRLTGCPLRCKYCDTTYAFSGGDWYSIENTLSEISRYKVKHVCVTGGEPLAQSRCLDLLAALCDKGYAVSLETSGALGIDAVDKRVSCVMDLKAPGSGEESRNRWENIPLLTGSDSLKIVICDRADYEWSRDILENRIKCECPVFLSPSADQLAPEKLAEWILEDRLSVRMQVQLHKVLWGNEPGR